MNLDAITNQVYDALVDLLGEGVYMDDMQVSAYHEDYGVFAAGPFVFHGDVFQVLAQDTNGVDVFFAEFRAGTPEAIAACAVVAATEFFQLG